MGYVRPHHGAMNTPTPAPEALAQRLRDINQAEAIMADRHQENSAMVRALARLAARWVVLQLAPDWPDENQRDITPAWRTKSPLALALLPDGQRALAAATQELLELLAQTPQGRQALADLGFQPFLEDIERP